MPEPFGALAPFLRFVDPITRLVFRRHKIASDELADLRVELNVLLSHVNSASVEAQTAVRASPNEDRAQLSHLAAVKLATEVGQVFASLFGAQLMFADVPATLKAARFRFREEITAEHNLDVVDPEERDLRCATIEAAAAELHAELDKEIFRRWGIGVGSRSGRIRGRKLPR